MAKVLLFGALSDLAGWREKTLEAKSVADLRHLLAAGLTEIRVLGP